MLSGRLDPSVFAFLGDLAENNSKPWFNSNKKRYEDELVEPVRAFIRGVAEKMPTISKQIVVSDKKVGGSLSRIFRDVRFSKDKSPYHTHVALRFWHDGAEKSGAPGYFLRIEPDVLTLGTGIFQPDKEPLAAIRGAIVARHAAWRKVVGDPAFRKGWGGLDGDSLKRPPQGFDAEHPAIEDLKRKDFVSFCEMKPSAATRKDFSARVIERWAASNPLMKFVCQALDLPF